MNLPENSHRRDFLKLGALAGLGLGLSAVPSAEAKPDPRDLKLLRPSPTRATSSS